MSWTRRKPMEAMVPQESGHQLARTLSWPHLLALGVGAIVGTGILTLIGVGEEEMVGPDDLNHGVDMDVVEDVAAALTRQITEDLTGVIRRSVHLELHHGL